MGVGHPRIWRSRLAQSLMQSEDASTPEAAIQKLVKRKLSMIAQPKLPVDLKMIASIVGIDPKFEFISMQEDGRLIEKDGKCIIQINKNQPEQRQRFSIGHEIGHKMLAGKHVTELKTRTNVLIGIEKDEEEILCDMISTYILGLNSDYLSPILLERGFSFDTIDYVCQQFKTSFESAARALTKYTSERVAVLYIMQQGAEYFVLRYYSATDFPYIGKGYKLPAYTFLKRAEFSQTIVRLPTDFQFGNFSCICDIEAKKMPIYVSNKPVNGIIAVVSIRRNEF